MSERRNHYYIDGSTVRKLDYSAEPVRREYEPARRTEMPAERPARRRQEKQTATPAVGLCFVMLKLMADVKEGKNEVSTLQSQLNEQLNVNAEYSSGLDSMTDLDEIYKIATTELGMVYSKPGQTVYYPQNSDDYVIQYKNVPETK